MTDLAIPAADKPSVALPPELEILRKEPFPEASTLNAMQRMQRIAGYQRIKTEFNSDLTIEEMRHIVKLMAGARADTLKEKRDSAKAAKKASATPIKPLSLDEL